MQFFPNIFIVCILLFANGDFLWGYLIADYIITFEKL